MNEAPTALRASATLGAGWQARLELQFQCAAQRTVVSHRRHQGPLMLQRAFYPESAHGPGALAAEPCHAYVIHPPGGIVSGDDLQLDVRIGPGAHALLTTPAAGKFYRRADLGAARLSQTLRVDGVLEWLPQENIYFPDCEARLHTAVHLRGSARFIGWEVGCVGLPVNGLTLGAGLVRQAFELWRDGTPLLLERTRLQAEALTARWGLAGYPSAGTWIASGATGADLTRAREFMAAALGADLSLACTLVDGLLIGRGMARRADRLKQIFIELWRLLRPSLLGRDAVLPRIWAT